MRDKNMLSMESVKIAKKKKNEKLVTNKKCTSAREKNKI